MLYKILFFPAGLFIRFYFRKIIISNKDVLRLKGPLLIASNHPNSFLDAIIITSLFRHPVHSLTRGDVFAGKFVTKILTALNMLPVYRISEGAKNLANNYATFDTCRNIFKKDGIVLIFSEACSVNEWRLRPLRKGTARLALSAWDNEVPLRVLPLGINYSSFRTIGKKVILNFGEVITKKEIGSEMKEGKSINVFNTILYNRLSSLVFKINSNDGAFQRKYFYNTTSCLHKIIWCIPALAGFIFHAPLYYLIHFAIKKKAGDHYDSIMLGVIFLVYPLYVLLLTFLVFLFIRSNVIFFLPVIIPATGATFIQTKSN